MTISAERGVDWRGRYIAAADPLARFIAANTHDLLRTMAEHSGVLEYGGLAIREYNAMNPLYGDVIGRTAWIGQPEWARGFGMSKDKIKQMVEKAIAGKRLGKRQAALLDVMLAEIASIRAVDELDPTWGKLSAEEQDLELDAIFGADSRPQSPAEAAPVSAPLNPSNFELTTQDEAELAAKATAALGDVEERAAALRDRNAVILTAPAGTAPPARLNPQPTVQ
ncbi:MAG: hypothetical protein ACREUY_10635, partial [Burkholderiales bacterium]